MNRSERRRILGQSKQRKNGPMLQREPQLRVLLMRNPQRPEVPNWIRVELESNKVLMLGVLKKQLDIFPHQFDSEQKFEAAVIAAAGAMAEMLNESYGDTFDPSSIAAMAKEMYREMKMDAKVHDSPTQERGYGAPQ